MSHVGWEISNFSEILLIIITRVTPRQQQREYCV
jgi:hypothetical protein